MAEYIINPQALGGTVFAFAPVVDIVDNGAADGPYLRIYHPWMECSEKNASVCLMRYTKKTSKRMWIDGQKGHARRARKYRFFTNLPYGLSRRELFDSITQRGCLIPANSHSLYTPINVDYKDFCEDFPTEEFWFTQRRKASCQFGIAIRYENPEFLKLVKGALKDSVTMINGVKRWIYSEVKPIKVYIHKTPGVAGPYRHLGISMLE